MSYELIDNGGGAAVPIKGWTRGVPVEDGAKEQLRRVAAMSCVWPHVAVMPDVHWGNGTTVGSVHGNTFIMTNEDMVLAYRK